MNKKLTAKVSWFDKKGRHTSRLFKDQQEAQEWASTQEFASVVGDASWSEHRAFKIDQKRKASQIHE